MPITRNFRETILSWAEHYAVFSRQMVTEAVSEMLTGDLEFGKDMRDYINATIE